MLYDYMYTERSQEDKAIYEEEDEVCLLTPN